MLGYCGKRKTVREREVLEEGGRFTISGDLLV